MKLEITNFMGQKVQLIPQIGLYNVTEFMGQALHGLSVQLNEADTGEPYTSLTVSFGEFISIKNSAYIDTNNCYFAEQILPQIAEKTSFTKQSGYCTYPLWVFNEDFLKEAGGSTYQKYSEEYDNYYKRLAETEEEEPEAIKLLKEKIEKNYSEYKEKWLGMTPQELIDRCCEIEAVTRMTGDVPNYVSEEEAQYLLKFKNPLEVVSDTWQAEYSLENRCVDEELSHLLWQLMDTQDAEIHYETEDGQSQSPKLSV